MSCLQGGNTEISLCVFGGLTPEFGANTGCVTKKGITGAEFPKCCDKTVCPRPDQCYSTALKRIFNDGEVWTEETCEQRRCEKGSIQASGCQRYPSVIGQNCVRTNGTPNASFPQCCEKLSCPMTCTSKSLNRTFQSGESWTESNGTSCLLAECSRGTTYFKACPIHISYCPLAPRMNTFIQSWLKCIARDNNEIELRLNCTSY